MLYGENVSLAWELLVPCCLVWDGVKLELELELELAGLGCSDFREEKKENHQYIYGIQHM